MSLGFGEETTSEHKLTDWKLGTTLQGETYTHEDLAGKVVVIEHWGVNCPPCVAAMPHLAQLDKRNRAKGLRIIASEAQNSPEEAIQKLTKEHKADYTITRGASGPISGNGIPRAVVFDVTGNVVFSGHPADGEFERAVRKALREVGKENTSTSKLSSVEEGASILIEERSWTNSDGKSMIAAALGVADGKVSFKMKNGSIISYELEKLSEGDQTLLKEASESVAPSE